GAGDTHEHVLHDAESPALHVLSGQPAGNPANQQRCEQTNEPTGHFDRDQNRNNRNDRPHQGRHRLESFRLTLERATRPDTENRPCPSTLLEPHRASSVTSPESSIAFSEQSYEDLRPAGRFPRPRYPSAAPRTPRGNNSRPSHRMPARE